MNNTWYEKLIEVLNRLIRPATVYSLMVLLMFGWYDPSRFLMFAKALKEVPELYWYGYLIVLLTISAPKMINSIRHQPTIVPTGPITTKTEVTVINSSSEPDPRPADGSGPSPMPPPPGSTP